MLNFHKSLQNGNIPREIALPRVEKLSLRPLCILVRPNVMRMRLEKFAKTARKE